MTKEKEVTKLATMPVVLSQMWTGAEYRARPRELKIGLPLSILVSCNFPVVVTSASPWRNRFCWSGTNLLKEKERDSDEFTLLRSNRKKVKDRERRTENEFWVWGFEVAMT
ncbi:hypothetical protein SESBI_04455 [Sesbania bispinosa]|nr:hypothetical protein SESBI_04455 [Sesbania bispinosa]